jgi:hypothetical protein
MLKSDIAGCMLRDAVSAAALLLVFFILQWAIPDCSLWFRFAVGRFNMQWGGCAWVISKSN